MIQKDLNTYTKAELLDYIKKMEANKSYGLVWEEELVHENSADQLEAKTAFLSEVKSKKIVTNKNETSNLLIEGDNLHSLTLLNQTHKANIDLIYIDPPYNTGKKMDFMYNDQYVDIDDTYRHSKWLSFMNKRLKLAASLLKQSGAIFISIDDNEIAQLKLHYALRCNAM